jgi:hypothetical protein
MWHIKFCLEGIEVRFLLSLWRTGQSSDFVVGFGEQKVIVYGVYSEVLLYKKDLWSKHEFWRQKCAVSLWAPYDFIHDIHFCIFANPLIV